MRLIYNLLFPLAFLFFLPGLLIKLVRRPGHKKTFAERFGIFSEDQKNRLKSLSGPIWVHAVSVGETVVALSMVRQWHERNPDRQFVLSTTTTTGQQLARDKAPDYVIPIYCPIDFLPFVRKTLLLINPAMLVIFETEIWPNLVMETRRTGAPVVLVNGRMSDKSSRGYARFGFFFRPVLEAFNLLCVQTDLDKTRYRKVSASVTIEVCGNLKFDQTLPEKLPEIHLSDSFGSGKFLILLGASTHPGEEKLLVTVFVQLREKFPSMRLVLMPRHAERGGEIAAELKADGVSFHRRTSSELPKEPVTCLLADTTGEMLAFMAISDIVVMGKSFAGHNEGHNLIEPAILGKPIVTGSVLTNFRFALSVLEEEGGVVTVDRDEELMPAIERLAKDTDFRKEIGTRAKTAIERHRGAADRAIAHLERILTEKP